VLRSVGAYLFAGALLLLSTSAFRQALSEFGDTEPGSLLFGVLQLVIGTSAVMAAIGLVRRARWASLCIAIWGAASAVLLAVQPLFEPMAPDAQQSIWIGAAAVVVVAAGVSWFAHRLYRNDAASRTAAERTPTFPPTLPLAPTVEAPRPVEPIIACASDPHVSRGT